jgi:c-di-GMP-binding flagellar brake protein YcgR
MTPEHRNMERIEIGRFVGRDQYGTSEGFFAVDLSRGGMSLLRVPGRDRRLEAGLDGDFAWISIPLPDRRNKLTAVAEVVHRREYGPLERIGVRFRYMSPADRKLLDEWLSAAA